MTTRRPSMVGIALIANLAVVAACLSVIGIQGCRGLSASSPSDCLPMGNKAGALSQTWALGKPPQGLTPGNYVVTLSNGEAELAGISLGGSELLITIPVPTQQIPAGGIGINTVQIDGQWVQLDCPAITK